ncbi:TetR/AcrR family transcriptional regulator [Listeria sp. PSOL-1]|uniref:TetR/AcrR family transcriptional regulator n=1 Tax=Listeria sp. PSOL-1 TaxID=1844999 RepID=UPI0013D1D846|nr:TetR/AcrR family transcriptional regulator [Listeria sp. PSOL-1]
MNGFKKRRQQKEEDVSQVTIYNYFESKDNLSRRVFLYYIEQATKDFEKLIYSNVSFPEKIKHLLFNEADMSTNMNPNYYESFMTEYSRDPDFAQIYNDKYIIPLLEHLFAEGASARYIDYTLNSQVLIFYMYKCELNMLKKMVLKRSYYHMPTIFSKSSFMAFLVNAN